MPDHERLSCTEASSSEEPRWDDAYEAPKSSSWPASPRLIPQELVARPKEAAKDLMRNPVMWVWVVIIVAMIMLMRLRSVGDFNDDQSLPSYCGAKPRGAEGLLHSPQPSMVLWAVALTIRHGDRSAIFAFPNTNETASWTCRPAGLDQRRAAQAVTVMGVDGQPLERRVFYETQ